MPKNVFMHLRRLIAILFLLFDCNALASHDASYVKIEKRKGRYLFHSKIFGSFFSVGSNSFMESAANLEIKAVFRTRPLPAIYEEQLRSYLNFGFNSLGGWSNTEYLKGRLPYPVVLFDDEEYPRSFPLKDCRGKHLPSGDAYPLPNPFNDPFEPAYINAVKQYLKAKTLPHTNDQSLMLYWVGHEFGVGGSDYIDLREFTYSRGVQNQFVVWLKKKYPSIVALQNAWNLKQKTFEDVVALCPQLKSDVEGNDRKEFMAYVLRNWFELVVGEIRKNDPNHLISTPKFSVWDHKPQLDLAERDGHFEAMRNLFDLISVDWYTAKSEFSELPLSQVLKVSSTLALPVLVAEFGTRQKINAWTNTPGAKTLLKSQEERGAHYRTQVMQLFDNKHFIGAHWFRWQDHITQTEQMNKGIVQVHAGKIDTYEPLQNAMAQAHREIAEKIKRE